MKIGIDVRCLTEGRRTGVEEYTINLLREVFRLDSRNEYLLFFNSFKPSLANFSWLKEFPNVRLRRFFFPNKILNLFFWYFDWPKIDQLLGKIDVFFMPNITFSSFSKKTRLVLTFHDLSFERYPETFSRKRRLWHFFVNPRRLCFRADKIIAVSESTKKDLVSLYRVNPAKISLIWSGLGERFRPLDRNDERLLKVKEKYKLPYRFILYLGTLEPRKNIIALIRAYNQLKDWANQENQEEIKKWNLILAGQSGWLMKKINNEIKKSPFREEIKRIVFIEDRDKEYFYNLSSIFVYPSFFEGFGFPPLEAMRCQIPTIISHHSVFPEVAGKGALLIDPERPEEIFQSLRELILNKDLAEKLGREGRENTKNLSWKKTAREFLQILKSWS